MTLTQKILRTVGLTVLVVLPLVILAWKFGNWRPSTAGIPSAGGAFLTVTNIPSQPYYLQTDPEWAEDFLGGTREPLRVSGCTLCCLSMALARYDINMRPNRLNRELRNRGGFTRQGWIKWPMIQSVVNGRVAIEMPDEPSHARLDAALSAGHPVLARILLPGKVFHWVLIVGKEGPHYLAKNPLDPERRIQKVSDLSDRICAIRIVQPPVRAMHR